MGSRSVGEDEFAPWQSPDFPRQHRVGLEAGPVDVVNKVQEALGQVEMLLHQPG